MDEEDQIPVIGGVGKEKRIRKKKRKTVEEAPEGEPPSCGAEVVQSSKKSKKDTHAEEVVTFEETEAAAQLKYEKAMSKKLPTREEKARRENQRKMQAFVAALREKGYSKKDIEKMKKKVTKKLKHIPLNTPYIDAVSDVSDRTLNCTDCGAEFVFSVREQAFYAEKKFPPPVRCRPCNNEKKLRMAQYD